MKDEIKRYFLLMKGTSSGNKRIIIGCILILAVVSVAAFAQQDHTCQGGFNCNDGGSDGQSEVSQSSITNSENTNISEAYSGSNSDASATSSSGGNSLSAGGGESSSSSRSSSGDSQATGGVSENDINIQSGGGEYYESANSAATVFAGHCQSGASAQISGGGFSVVNSEQFCDYIRLAAVMREAYAYEMRDCKCEGICTIELATVEMNCTLTPKAALYIEAYHHNLWQAQELLDDTATTGKIDRMTGQLIKTIGLIGLLIWL